MLNSVASFRVIKEGDLFWGYFYLKQHNDSKTVFKYLKSSKSTLFVVLWISEITTTRKLDSKFYSKIGREQLIIEKKHKCLSFFFFNWNSEQLFFSFLFLISCHLLPVKRRSSKLGVRLSNKNKQLLVMEKMTI